MNNPLALQQISCDFEKAACATAQLERCSCLFPSILSFFALFHYIFAEMTVLCQTFAPGATEKRLRSLFYFILFICLFTTSQHC